MKIPGYNIQQQIGEGGMASAYLAIQESLGRLVVLKVLNTSNHGNPHNIKRFLNEGRIIASLNHPNIITVFDIGAADDFLYMCMEYVEGGDLRQRMRSLIPVAEALDILIKIGSGLSSAHKKGIVHRDVKPGNILFRKDGTPLLSDFGIAKQLTIDHDLTSTGTFLGSPNYMAPEQAETGTIDGRVDIYSLGIIFYEMLTGCKPYQSESVVDVIIQHKQAPIPQFPSGLEQFQPLLNLMVAKHRKDRFRDADSLLHYVRHMIQSGVLKTASEIIERPDFDVTGEQPMLREVVQQRTGAVTRPRTTRRVLYVLATLLALALAGNGILLYIDAKINENPPVRLPPNYNPVTEILPPPPALPAPKSTQKEVDPATLEVIRALTWLAQKSLNEYRLTHPPKDNAYYYYSRLLEIDPASAQAHEGMLKIAERFAFLAERALAENQYERAQAYISIGLQIDPNNKTLKELQNIARPQKKGVFDNLFRFFH